jgi:hypothetical protein
MNHQYENFEKEFQREICENCPNYTVYLDWDEGGPDIAGGMAPTKVVIHHCLYGESKGIKSCQII